MHVILGFTRQGIYDCKQSGVTAILYSSHSLTLRYNPPSCLTQTVANLGTRSQGIANINV